MDLQYPWEAEEQAAREAQEAHFEKVAERGWQTPSVSQARLEEIRLYGLDHWIYLRFLRAISRLFALEALLAVPKLAVLSRSSGIQQRDPLAWLARLSLGNAVPGHNLKLGLVDLRVDDSSVLASIDALQWVILLSFIVWFVIWFLPTLAEDPELRLLSAADYAVQVDGLPPQLPENHHQYEMELIRHFEGVLRELQGGDPNAHVYEAALVRDFSRGLYAAQELLRLETELRGGKLEEASPRALSAKRERHLKTRQEAMSKIVATSRMDEAERSVKRAYIICSTRKERAELLREYRFSTLPVVGRCLQPSHLWLYGRWPLTVRPAPEPTDIRWAHFGWSTQMHVRSRVTLVIYAALVFLTSAALCCMVWWSLLGIRGESAVQCTIGSTWRQSSDDSLAPFCLSPPLLTADTIPSDTVWEQGCDCMCTDRSRWWTDSGDCETLGALNASATTALIVIITECAHRFLLVVVPMLINSWHHILKSDVECSILSVITGCTCVVPVMSSFGHFFLKVILRSSRAQGLAEPLLWEVDRGWYLHAAPIVVLWCLLRWLRPVVFLCATFCKGAARVKEHALLRERYATLAAEVAIVVALQALLPCLTPLAALGLFLRYRVERRCLLRGQVVPQASLSFATSRRMICIAGTYMWLGVMAGSALAVWVFGDSEVARSDVDPQHSFISRGLTNTALPALLTLCLSICVPLCSRLSFFIKWFFVGPRHETATRERQMNYQEAWLIMAHSGEIATYQLRDMPGEHGAAVLDSLHAEGAAHISSAPSFLSREGDVTPNLAIVGDKAPTREGKAPSKYTAQSQVQLVLKEANPQADYWSQLRSGATVSPAPLGRGRIGEAV